jgi:PHD/YefM family antitoxin component YafN of YafNO toxin-antitoxin module
MKTVTLKQAREDFDALVAAGKEEPVAIMRDGERIGVFISDADAELIEETLLAQKAAIARAEGFVGVVASKTFLDRFRGDAAD